MLAALMVFSKAPSQSSYKLKSIFMIYNTPAKLSMVPAVKGWKGGVCVKEWVWGGVKGEG